MTARETTIREAVRLPLLLTMVMGLAACSTSLDRSGLDRSADLGGAVFGSESDTFDFGVAPSGRIGPSVSATTAEGATRAPALATDGAAIDMPADGALAPAVDSYEGTTYVGVVGESYPSYEGYAVPTYPAPAPAYWDSHEEAVVPMAEESLETMPVPVEGVPAPPPEYGMPMMGQPYPMQGMPMQMGPRRVGDMTVDELRAELGGRGRYQARSVPGSCGTSKRNVCDPCDRDTQVGVFFGIFPGIGGGIEWLREFKTTRTASFHWDVSMVYQDLYDIFDDESQTGKYNALRLGVKAVFAPRAKFHPTARAGITWFRASGNPEVISVADFNKSRDEDYIGAYVAVGFDWDVTDCVTIGPEIGYVYGYAPGVSDWGGTLEARFHVLFRF